MDNRLFYQTGLISFGVYLFCFLVFVIVFYQSKLEDKDYSFRQETSFEVSVDLSGIKDIEIKEKPKSNKTNKNDKQVLKKEGSLTHKRGVDFDSLFSNVQEVTKEKKLEKYKFNSSKAVDISRKYGQKKDTIAGNLNSIYNNLNEVKLPSSYSSNAKFNNYYSKINKMLTVEFNNQLGIRGSFKSVVLVSIDSRGRFSYKIARASKSDIFNNRLLQFLNRMTSKDFPPYSKNITTIEITFKTEE